MFDDGGKIVRVAIHVVARGGLTGSTVTPPVVGDDAKALLHEKQHLRIPRIGVERPSVREGDDGAAAPVLVVNRRAVFGSDGVHSRSSSWLDGWRDGVALRSAACRGGKSGGHGGDSACHEYVAAGDAGVGGEFCMGLSGVTFRRIWREALWSHARRVASWAALNGVKAQIAVAFNLPSGPCKNAAGLILQAPQGRAGTTRAELGRLRST